MLEAAPSPREGLPVSPGLCGWVLELVTIPSEPPLEIGDIYGRNACLIGSGCVWKTWVGHWQLVALLVTRCLCWHNWDHGWRRSSLQPPAYAWGCKSKALWLTE